MIQLKEGELLSNHTTFRIGGAAKYFAVPKNEGGDHGSGGFCHREGAAALYPWQGEQWCCSRMRDIPV